MIESIDPKAAIEAFAALTIVSIFVVLLIKASDIRSKSFKEYKDKKKLRQNPEAGGFMSDNVDHGTTLDNVYPNHSSGSSSDHYNE